MGPKEKRKRLKGLSSRTTVLQHASLTRSWAVSVPRHLQQKSQGWSFREEKQILSLNRPQRIKEVKKQTFCTSGNRSNFCRDDCCLRHPQGSGRGGWMNIARRRGCAALPWEPFGVPFINKVFFHRKIRVWRELCSIPEHVPGWPASLETAVATALQSLGVDQQWERGQPEP